MGPCGEDGEPDGDAFVGVRSVAESSSRVGTSGRAWSRCGLSGASSSVASTATATTATAVTAAYRAIRPRLASGSSSYGSGDGAISGAPGVNSPTSPDRGGDTATGGRGAAGAGPGSSMGSDSVTYGRIRSGSKSSAAAASADLASRAASAARSVQPQAGALPGSRDVPHSRHRRPSSGRLSLLLTLCTPPLENSSDYADPGFNRP